MNPNHSFGRRWGGYLGARGGEWLGDNAVNLAMMAGKAIGLGDYAVSKNVLSGNLPVMTNPISSSGNTIRFQEYLGDVVTSATAGEFSINNYIINAANAKTFPWLSQIASNYEQYEIEGLLFYFKSTSGDALNSTNTALGTVMLATQYDVMDENFKSKSEMLNYEFSSSGKPSDTIVHMIECDPRQQTINLLYTLPDGQAIPDGADKRLYELGRFAIATTGFQAASVNIGELHITYQVRLLKPKLVDSLGSTNAYLSRHAILIDNATPFGTNQVTSRSATGPKITNNSTVFFPQSAIDQTYQMVVFWVNSMAPPLPTSFFPPTFTADSNITCALAAQAPELLDRSTKCMAVYYITVKANPTSSEVVFDPSVFDFSGGSHVDCYVNIDKVNPDSIKPAGF